MEQGGKCRSGCVIGRAQEYQPRRPRLDSTKWEIEIPRDEDAPLSSGEFPHALVRQPAHTPLKEVGGVEAPRAKLVGHLEWQALVDEERRRAHAAGNVVPRVRSSPSTRAA